MRYFSTRNMDRVYSFKEAVLKGLADDSGLFLPDHFPLIKIDSLKTSGGAPADTAAFVLRDYLEDISENNFSELTTNAFNFSAPVVRLDDGLSVLELFHGPTCAFKDFGARFLAELIAYYLCGRRCTILVATSGDTGSAVASAFYGKDTINVVLLYPSGKVSRIQEQQLTTFGGNIHALEINGTFDDCQRLVKEAFADKELNERHYLTSANSINIGRLLPQAVYYFHAYQQMQSNGKEIVFTVPSGNLGNLTSGIIALRSGLPVRRFVSAMNANDVFLRYLNSGDFVPVDSARTLSNAMDVGNPSNLERLRCIYNNDVKQMTNVITGYSFDDTATIKAIKEVKRHYNYALDPHTAVAYLAAQKDQELTKGENNYVLLATAHPAKFTEEISTADGGAVKTPDRLAAFLKKKKRSIRIEKNYQSFKTTITALLS